MSNPQVKAELRALTEAERETALKVLVEQAGNVKAAARLLGQQFGIPVSTVLLSTWRDATYRERYHELATTASKQLEEQLVQDTREIALRAGKAELRLVEEVERLLDENRIREPGRVALEMSKVKQSNIDKLLALTGRPATITIDRSAVELIRALEGLGVLRRPVESVQSTAVEVT